MNRSAIRGTPVVVAAVAALLSAAHARAADDVPYRVPTKANVTDVLRRVGKHLAAVTPVPAAPPTTAQAATQPSNFSANRFTLVTYPLGVAYAGMLSAGDATGDPSFDQFVVDRFQYLADRYAALPPAGDTPRARPAGPLGPLVAPRSLDDCGAMAMAMLKARRLHVGPDMRPLFSPAITFATRSVHHLPDGTIGREHPVHDSLWADDMYMAGPLLAQAAVERANDPALLDEAAHQVLLLGDHLFVPAAGLFTHGWNGTTADQQPRYHWGRANGWCAMAMAELLDVLPEDHPRRPAVLALFRAHAKGIASCQGGTGLWHQVLDRPDSYVETSCSAMFAFALAKGVNRGWLDPMAYGPVAITGWDAVAAQVADDGRVRGTCIGTSYADDPAYYYHRPVGDDDPHGYGPTLMAGAEVIRLLDNKSLKVDGGRGNPIVVRRAAKP